MRRAILFAILSWLGCMFDVVDAFACPASPPGTDAAPRLLRPVDANAGAGFGLRKHPILGIMRAHNGVEFPGRAGAPVSAALGGRVVDAGHKGEFGNTVLIEHGDGVATVYAHLARFAAGIESGACVLSGDIIGFVGSTGLAEAPKLYFEVRRGGIPVDTADMIEGGVQRR